jgi:hypothetical protein
VILATALGIEAATLGEGLEEGRLPRTVLAHEKSDVRGELEVDAAGEGLDRERVSRRVHRLGVGDDGPQEGTRPRDSRKNAALSQDFAYTMHRGSPVPPLGP